MNHPLTGTVRAGARMFGVNPEFAIKHLPHSGVTRMRLPGGRRARLWSRGDDWVSNQVYWHGWNGYEPEVAPLFWRLATKATVTIDVGAYVGYYTLLAALANPRGTVFAFEPQPEVFRRLQRNVRLNRLANVSSIRCAVGASDGAADFFHVPGVPTSSSLSEDFMSEVPGAEVLAVEALRIDSFLRQREVSRVDLIKLDTETTEPDALTGMGQVLRESRPDIICEVLTQADTKALMSILEPLGYRFYLLTDNGPELREVIVPHSRYLNYFFTTTAEVSEAPTLRP